MSKIWNNGKIIDDEDFCISPFDRGLTLGLGAFETMVAIEGEIRYFDRHVKRLSKAINDLGLEKIDREEIIKGALDLCELLELRKARIRLSVTAGEGSLNKMKAGKASCSWMLATPLLDQSPAVTVVVPWRRNEHSALMGIKSASYAENIVAQSLATARGASDAIFLNTAGNLCEAATSNIFLVINNSLITPCLKCGCLPGVMREIAIDIARKNHISLTEREVSCEMIDQAEEIFLTSAIRGVNWVAKWENKVFEKEGNVTKKIREILEL
jgi:branched-chain amino acid aminotransferase